MSLIYTRKHEKSSKNTSGMNISFDFDLCERRP